MTQTAITLKTFVGSFGLPAYCANTVPDDVQLPYLTYPNVEPEWNQKTTFYIQGWFNATDNDTLITKADQILREVGTGIILGMDEGSLVIYPENPSFQQMTEENVQSFYLNFSLNSYHIPGV